MSFCGFCSFSNQIVYFQLGLESFFFYISKTPRTITLGVRDFDIQILGTHKHLVHNAGDDQGPVAPCSFPNGLWNLEPIADSWKDKKLVLN